MAIDIKKYPLDLTAEAKSNYIDRERKEITDELDYLITVHLGIFYAKKLVIQSVNENRILELNTDYVLNYLSQEVSIRSGNAAYSLIVITNHSIKGPLLISYQCVGGEYTKLDSAMIAAIDQINSIESKVKWDSIVNKPLTYPPSGHEHIADDIVGTDDIVNSLDSLALALQGLHPDKAEQLTALINSKVSNVGYRRINQVERNWLLDSDSPLRISIRPFPSAIVVGIDIWQTSTGYSNLEVSGELSGDGVWQHKKYMITKGEIPSIDVQLTTIDGSSAEVLIRSINNAQCFVSPNVVTYLKHNPTVTSISCLNLTTFPSSIPDEFEIPKVAWLN